MLINIKFATKLLKALGSSNSFETFDPKVGRIKEILLEMDVNTMTPVECLMRLNGLKRLAEE